MVASFSSKLSTHAKTALTVLLLWVCMIGSQWFGYAHSVSHANYQQTAISQITSADTSTTLSHSSDACHLFDALTLAGFIPATHESSPALLMASAVSVINPPIQIAQTVLPAYQSRAPPYPLL